MRLVSNILFMVLSVILLQACQTTGPRDSSGTLMKLETLDDKTIADARFTIPFFINPDKFKGYKQVRRDGGNVITESYHFKSSSNYFIRVQMVTRSWFDASTNRLLKDYDAFAKKFNLNYGEIIEFGKHTRNYLGFAFRYNKGKCYDIFAGKRIKPMTGYSDDRGQMDTIIDADICDDALLISPEQLLDGLSQTKPSQKAEIMARFTSKISNDSSANELRSIAFVWEGHGTFTSNNLKIGMTESNGRYSFSFSIDEDGKQVECNGSYNITHEDDTGGSQGTWKMNCANGMDASGKWKNLEGIEAGIAGEGKDSNGNSVAYTINSIS